MSDPSSKSANIQAAFPWLIAALLLLCHVARGQTLDTITFGNTMSEGAHGLSTDFPAVTGTAIVAAGGGVNPSNPSSTAPSDTVMGALGLSARQLLPRTPNADIYGGEMFFTMTVDPAQQNYFTIKLYGSDTSINQWFVLDCNGLEVGWRHAGEDQEMLWSLGVTWFPGRFIYRTVPLPLNLTVGQTSVTIKIRSLGQMFYYAAGAYFGDYQKLMNEPSLSLYSAYTHTGGYFNASSETQGTAPTVLTPLTTPTQATTVANWESAANSKATSLLTGSASSMTPANIDFLAQCYGVSWTSVYNNSSVPGAVIAGIDAQVTAVASDTNGMMDYMGNFGNPSWGGYLGPLGNAIILMWPEISGSLSTTVAYGGTIGTVTRQSAWSQALRASIDYGRFNRRGITNQEMYCTWNIYRANRGLELVDPSNALYESEAVRYLYEATGVSPWLGDDQPGEGPVPVRGTEPYGPNWYMVTSQGLTKEDGMVGGDYGEKGASCYAMGVLAGDANLTAQGVKMLNARAGLRFPTVNGSNYLEEQVTEFIGCRNDQEMPGHVAYLEEDNLDTDIAGTDGALVAGRGASAVGNNLVGYFKQGLTDGQYYANLTTSQGNLEYGPYFPDYLNAALAAAASVSSTNVLPMTTGQPNFASADGQDMVVAAKHGSGSSEERFSATLYWRGGQGETGPNAINGLAKIFDETPQTAWVAEVQEDDVQYVPSGQAVTRNGSVDENGNDTPPDNPVNANNGVTFAMALRPDLASPPPYNKDAGRATAYTLHYGHWLVGMNAHPANSYAMKLPSGFSSAVDLVSGNTFSAPVTLAPMSTVVFYLPTTSGSTTVPGTPLYFNAMGHSSNITLSWNPVSGATSYILERGTASGGPFSVIASGLSALAYTDTNVVSGSTYYYSLTGSNSFGLGAQSTVISGEAGLPSPWTSADIGTVSTPGSSSFSNGVFSIDGSGSDIGSTSDSFQFSYIPMSGNMTITARLTGLNDPNNSSKVGLMIRQSLAAGSPQVMIAKEGSSVLKMLWRSGTSANTTLGNQITATVSQWLRLVRTGTNFTAYYSTDGNTWTATGDNCVVSLTDPIYVGLAACSRATTLVDTNFQNVNVPGWTPPAEPSAPQATLSGSNVAMGWNPVLGATIYNVKRSYSSTGPFDTIASGVTGNDYTDSGLQGTLTGQNYYYVISALNSQSESPNSPVTVATVYSPPSAPVSITAMGVNAGQVALSWSASTGASGYEVYRSGTSGGPYVLDASGITGTSYLDTGVSPGLTYFYVVTATDAYGQSLYSNEIAVVSGTFTLTGSYSYNGEIALTSSGILNINDSTGDYAVSTVRASSLGVNGGQAFQNQSNGREPANFILLGSGTGNTDDILGPLTLNSGAFFGVISPNTAYNATVTFTSLTRNHGTQFNFGHSTNFPNAPSAGVGGDAIGTGTNSASVVFSTAPNNLMVGGSGADGTNTVNILPFAFVNNDLTTYDSTYGLRGLNTGTEMATLASGVTGAENAILDGNTTLQSGTTSINGLCCAVSGTISGPGTLNVISGAIECNYTYTINNSVLAFGGAEGEINVANARTLTINSSITGNVGVTICLENYNGNNASLVLGGSNTYFGITIVEGNSSNLKVELTNGSALQNSTLDYNGYGASVQFGISGGKNLTSAIFGGLDGAQNLALVNSGSSGGGVSLTIGPDGASTVYSGALSGAGSLTKTGTGTLILTASNTYTGTTKVSAGGLYVNGSLASGSAVTVSSGATLGGTGTIAGPVTVASGGTLAPGGGAPGVLKLTGSAALNSGSILNFTLGTSGSSNQLALIGSYSGPGTGAVIVNTVSLTNTTAGIYSLITGATGISAGSFTLGAAPSGYNYALSATAGTLSLSVSAPAAPAILTATGTNGSVSLSWSASSGAMNYDVQRSLTSGSGYALLTAVSGTTTYADTAVTNGTTYYYVVSAVNLAGPGVNSTQASATPLSLLQVWRLANFGTISNSGSAADSACLANDGICNLLKYAAGKSPLTPTPSVTSLGLSATNNALTLTFNRIADPALTYSVLASTDLTNWQPIWTSSGFQNVSGPVTVTDGTSPYTNPAGFVELQISY